LLAYSRTEGVNASTKATLVTIPPDEVGGTLGLSVLDRRLRLGTRIVYNDARKNFPASALIPDTKAHALVDLFASYEHHDWLAGTRRATPDQLRDESWRRCPMLGFEATGCSGRTLVASTPTIRSPAPSSNRIFVTAPPRVTMRSIGCAAGR
jgi:hypothetical protein